jgi:hypothetical protein
VSTLRSGPGGRVQFRVGAPDPSLTAPAGLLAVAEFADRAGLIGTLDAAVPGAPCPTQTKIHYRPRERLLTELGQNAEWCDTR